MFGGRAPPAGPWKLSFAIGPVLCVVFGDVREDAFFVSMTSG